MGEEYFKEFKNRSLLDYGIFNSINLNSEYIKQIQELKDKKICYPINTINTSLTDTIERTTKETTQDSLNFIISYFLKMTKKDIDIEAIINYQKAEFQHIFDRLKNRQFNTPYNLKDGMLYFKEKYNGKKENRLVLPSVILSNILYKLHTRNDSHMLGVEMEKYIKANYKIKNFKHIEKLIRKQCIGCCISQSSLNQKTRTSQRSYSYKVAPGEHFFIDAFYLSYNKKE